MDTGIHDNSFVGLDNLLLVLVVAVVKTLDCELGSQSSGRKGGESLVQLVHQQHNTLEISPPSSAIK